jgi:hypothetical protein
MYAGVFLLVGAAAVSLSWILPQRLTNCCGVMGKTRWHKKAANVVLCVRRGLRPRGRQGARQPGDEGLVMGMRLTPVVPPLRLLLGELGF